jgi:hypothetical protein
MMLPSGVKNWARRQAKEDPKGKIQWVSASWFYKTDDAYHASFLISGEEKGTMLHKDKPNTDASPRGWIKGCSSTDLSSNETMLHKEKPNTDASPRGWIKGCSSTDLSSNETFVWDNIHDTWVEIPAKVGGEPPKGAASTDLSLHGVVFVNGEHSDDDLVLG